MINNNIDINNKMKKIYNYNRINSNILLSRFQFSKKKNITSWVLKSSLKYVSPFGPAVWPSKANIYTKK